MVLGVKVEPHPGNEGFDRNNNNKMSGAGKDHIYRMVIVEGRCTMARSSSFRSKLFIG